MALDLDDPKAVDYSSSSNLLPFDAFGDFDLEVTAFTESGPAGTEGNPGEKEYDLASCVVLKVSQAADCRSKLSVGEETGLFFQTGGNGMTVKNRPYKAAQERALLAACFGENPKDPAFKGKDARKQLLATDLETNKVRIRLYRRPGNPILDDAGNQAKDEDGKAKHWPEDRYAAIT